MQLRRDVHDNISASDLKRGSIKNIMLSLPVAGKEKGSQSFKNLCHIRLTAIHRVVGTTDTLTTVYIVSSFCKKYL